MEKFVPEGFIEAANMCGQLKPETVKKLFTHATKAAYRQKLPLTSADISSRATAEGVELSQNDSRNVANFFAYLGADRSARRFRKAVAASELSEAHVEVMAAVIEQVEDAVPPVVAAAPQLCSFTVTPVVVNSESNEQLFEVCLGVCDACGGVDVAAASTAIATIRLVVTQRGLRDMHRHFSSIAEALGAV